MSTLNMLTVRLTSLFIIAISYYDLVQPLKGIQLLRIPCLKLVSVDTFKEENQPSPEWDT